MRVTTGYEARRDRDLKLQKLAVTVPICCAVRCALVAAPAAAPAAPRAVCAPSPRSSPGPQGVQARGGLPGAAQRLLERCRDLNGAEWRARAAAGTARPRRDPL